MESTLTNSACDFVLVPSCRAVLALSRTFPGRDMLWILTKTTGDTFEAREAIDGHRPWSSMVAAIDFRLVCDAAARAIGQLIG